MAEGIAADLNGIVDDRFPDVTRLVGGYMQQPGYPQHQTNVFAAPLPHVTVFLAKIDSHIMAEFVHPANCLGGEMQRNRITLRPFQQPANQIIVIILYGRRNRLRPERPGHGRTRNVDIQQPGQKAPAVQHAVLHDFTQDAGLCADDHRQGWMPDVVRLTVDAIHTNGVPADAFQPDIQIGFLGVTPNDVVEGTALGGDERHAPAIVL